MEPGENVARGVVSLLPNPVMPRATRAVKLGLCGVNSNCLLLLNLLIAANLVCAALTVTAK